MNKDKTCSIRRFMFCWIVGILLSIQSVVGQTTFYVTDQQLNNSVGSLDLVLNQAMTSANTGSNVTVYFNVMPDLCGNAMCYIDQQLVDLNPTSGSILLTSQPGTPATQGMIFSSATALQKIFKGKGSRVHFTELSIRSSAQPLNCNIHIFAPVERKLTGVNYKSNLGKVYFSFEDEYKGSAVLSYKVYNSANNVVLSASNLITKLQGTSTGNEYGDNRYELNASSLGAGTYILEVQNDKNEKFYLRFTR